MADCLIVASLQSPGLWGQAAGRISARIWLDIVMGVAEQGKRPGDADGCL